MNCDKCKAPLTGRHDWIVVLALPGQEGYTGGKYCSTWCAVDDMADTAELNNMLLERAEQERLTPGN